MTVAQLTSVFSLCNTVGFIVIFLFALLVPDIAHATAWEMYLTFIACTMGPYFNSLINPIILISRGKTLRTFSQESYYNRTRVNSRSPEDNETSKVYIINSVYDTPLQIKLNGQDSEPCLQ